MTTAISTKSITTTCTMEALSFKNRMLTCIGTSPSPMITRTCQNCITVMIIRSQEEQGVELPFRGARPLTFELSELPHSPVDTCFSEP